MGEALLSRAQKILVMSPRLAAGILHGAPKRSAGTGSRDGAGTPERAAWAGQTRETPKARSAIHLNSKDKRKPG